MGSTSYCKFSVQVLYIAIVLILLSQGRPDQCVVELGDGIQEILAWFSDFELPWQYETSKRAASGLER